MNIADYLNEIEHASTSLLQTIWDEHTRIGQIEDQITNLAPVVEDNYRRAQSVQQFAEDSDDVMMGVGMYWENYFGADKELYHKDQDRQQLVNQIATHSFSVASLAGSLLQHAKQGISLAHGGLGNCPNGRAIGSQHLKTVIWQSRNQTIHWEDGNFHPPTTDCFNALAADIDPKYNQFTNRNMAFDVIELLGWKSFKQFSDDLTSLA